MHIHQNADNSLLAIDNGHAKDALVFMRNIFTITLILGVSLEPVSSVVDVQNFACRCHILSDLSKNRAVDVFSFVGNVGNAVASLRLMTKKHARTEALN